jgi:hypothetical protein
MKTGFLVNGLLLSASVVMAAEMRTWTFTQSGKTMEAEVAGFSGDAVMLKDADGQTVSVPIAYLTQSDRDYLAGEQSKQWKQVEVIKLDAAGSTGRYQKCSVRGSDVNGDVLVAHLPSSVEAILNNRNQQATQITNLSNRIDSENRAVQQAKATLPSTAYGNWAYRRAVATQRAQVNLEAQDVKTAQGNLAKLQKSYDDYNKKTKDQTTLKMRNTGLTIGGLPVWECYDARHSGSGSGK